MRRGFPERRARSCGETYGARVAGYAVSGQVCWRLGRRRQGGSRRDFGAQLIEELLKKSGSTVGFRATGGGQHGVLEGEEFEREMIDGEGAIIGGAVVPEGVVGMIERAAQGGADLKDAGETDGAEGIQAVGVLKHAGFERLGREAGGEAVSLDGVGNGSFAAVGPAEFGEPAERLLGGELGGLGAVGRVFGDRDAVMQPGSGEDDEPVGSLGGAETAGSGEDAMEVLEVVGGIGMGARFDE